MSNEAAGKNPLALSDEDFLNQPFPGSEEPAETVQEVPNDKVDEAAETKTEVAKVEPTEVEVEAGSNVVDKSQPSSKPGANDGNVPTNAEVKQDNGKDVGAVSETETKSADKDPATQGKDQPGTVDTKPANQAATAVDYEAFYKQVMAPFKANGKTIELRDVNEAIQLMQMGANYTRKMQDITPHRKTLLMLENAQLLDPDKLSFLIDLNSGDPKAIQKLLKDKGVDPMSIDTSEDSNYLGGNHKVSDEEANFRSTLDELTSHQEGKATLQTIDSTWDQASKEVLWKQPQIMQVMHQQRENGIYDRISAEVNRQRTLGALPADLPFIQAYKVVGDAMQGAGAFNDLVKPTVAKEVPASSGSAEVIPKEPVATRVVTPKPAVSNSDQASAAASTRSTPREVKKLVNPLSMSDDEFLKLDQFRV